MFEVENCYRIIFEAMMEDSVLASIAERINQYAKVGIAFVTGAGRILACSCSWREHFPLSAEKGHLTMADYEAIWEKGEPGSGQLCVTQVQNEKKVTGYVVLVYEDEEKAACQELGSILSENVKRFFEGEQSYYVFNQSLRRHMISWAIFEDDGAKMLEEGTYPEEKYVVLLLHRKEGMTEELVARLRSMWASMYLYEEKEDAFLLWYHLTEEEASGLYEQLEAKEIRCCVSEVFSKLGLCKSRKSLLKRVALAEDSGKNVLMRREKEWAMRGFYTYTVSLIGKFGLSDYSVDRLILEDEKNHTDLYHTLKTYLFSENNVTTAAKALHIHRNTLVYRLRQIKECLGIDINDYEVSRELLAFIMMNDVWKQGIRSES